MASVTEGAWVRARASFRPSFHLSIILIMIAIVFAGFGLTYIGPVATGTRPPDSPIVHLHGFAWFSWMLLLLVQAVLVNAKTVKLHRSLGLFGIAVATFATTMGVFIMLAAASITVLKGIGPQMYWLNVTAPPSFAAIFAMAIWQRNRPEVHRNLMLIATVAILMPGINRVFMSGFGVESVPFIRTYLTMDALVAALLWHERKLLGRISGPTLAGAGIVVGLQLLNYPVSTQPWWSEFVYWLGSLVEYH